MNLTLDDIAPSPPLAPEIIPDARPIFFGSVEAEAEVLLYIDGELAASDFAIY